MPVTTTEPTASRKPTAKEIAEEAAQGLAQLRAELTEIRDQLREGGPVTIAQTEAATPAQLDDLENRTADGFERLQASVDQLKARVGEVVEGPAVVAIDPEVVKAPLAELEAKVAESFKAYSKIVDSHNEAATKAIEELREQMPSVVDLARLVGELDEKVRLFDEAGVAPASAEDVGSLDARLKAVEEIAAGNKLPMNVTVLTEDGATAATGHDLNLVHERINDLERQQDKLATHLENPAASAEVHAMNRAADRLQNVPAVYGQVHQLMKLVPELGKDSEADKKMGGYKFRSIEAAMDVVGRALREVGVMFQPREILEKRIERYETVSKDGYRQNWTHVWVTQRYAFVSLLDGSEMDAIEMDGEARDNGDKSTSKADSMRLKYALLQALMIPVNGLPESDGRDGTEGGQVHGRGDAGESWENATPARPQEQQTAYGYGHQPAESPGGQAHAQAAQEAEEDTRTPAEKATAAYNALVALAGIEKERQRPRLNKILNGISDAGIGHVLIQTADGRQATLDQYAAVVNAQVGA